MLFYVDRWSPASTSVQMSCSVSRSDIIVKSREFRRNHKPPCSVYIRCRGVNGCVGLMRMRILLVATTLVRSSDAPLLLKRAFERLGCTVRFVSTTEDLPLLADLSYRGSRPTNPLYRWAFNRSLLHAAREFSPEVVFLHGSNWCVLPGTIPGAEATPGMQGGHLGAEPVSLAAAPGGKPPSLRPFLLPRLVPAPAPQGRRGAAGPTSCTHAPTRMNMVRCPSRTISGGSMAPRSASSGRGRRRGSGCSSA